MTKEIETGRDFLEQVRSLVLKLLHKLNNN